MTSLGLCATDAAAASKRTTSHLFDTPPKSERYRPNGWAYAVSAALHATAMSCAVVLAHFLLQAPRPAPLPQARKIAHTFVLTGFSVGHGIRPRAHKTPQVRDVPVAVPTDATPAPLPPASGETRTAATSPVVEEKPVQRAAFDPPIPRTEAPRMTGRYGDPKEAGFGSATATVRGVPGGEIRSGGFGDANVRDVGTDPSPFAVRSGLDDGGEGNGATPPHIEEPLPIPDYPPEARTRRLQGVVVLEVILDALGKAHVRGVLSDRLGFGIEEAATNAAERLKFTPARQGGRFVDAVVRVRVTFTLTGSATAVTGGA